MSCATQKCDILAQRGEVCHLVGSLLASFADLVRRLFFVIVTRQDVSWRATITKKSLLEHLAKRERQGLIQVWKDCAMTPSYSPPCECHDSSTHQSIHAHALHGKVERTRQTQKKGSRSCSCIKKGKLHQSRQNQSVALPPPPPFPPYS